MAPARGRCVHPDGRAAHRVLRPAAVLRPGPVGGFGQVAERSLRVATWNIRAAIGPGEPFPPAWWRHVSRERFERIAQIIAALDADVVGLQEVAFIDVGGEVIDQPLELGRLTDRAVRYGAVHAFALVEPENGRSIGTATWGNALLTREPLHDGFARGLPLGADDEPVEPEGSDRDLAGVAFRDAPYGTREPRCVVGGRVASGGGATVLCTHLTYAGTGQRRAQADELAAIADDLGGPVAVLGDLNAPIEAPELAGLRAGFDDAFAMAGIAPGDPRRATSGLVAIDHVLTRGLAVEDCRVHIGAGDASDHLPVVGLVHQIEPSRSSSRAT